MIYFRDLDRVEVCGNFGNNLFQLATAIALAEENGTEVVIPDTWRFKPQIPEQGALRYAPKASFKITEEYSEPGFQFHTIPYVNGMNMNGYYQSYKFFEPIADKIKNFYFRGVSKEFAVGSEPYIKALFPEGKESKIIAIHVRRGDYLNFPNHFARLDMNYYGQAISYFNKRYHKPKFLVFSNDIQGCKSMFIGDEFIFSETPQESPQGNSSTLIDFTMMTSCDGFIIGNSSFSWWAAYLNQYIEKKVIAPNTWFGPALAMNDTKDLYLPEWIRM